MVIPLVACAFRQLYVIINRIESFVQEKKGLLRRMLSILLPVGTVKHLHDKGYRETLTRSLL